MAATGRKNCSDTIAPWRLGRVRRLGRALRVGAGRAFETLTVWNERRRQRHALRHLDDAMLKDLGLSRADVEGEAGKPFWRP